MPNYIYMPQKIWLEKEQNRFFCGHKIEFKGNIYVCCSLYYFFFYQNEGIYSLIHDNSPDSDPSSMLCYCVAWELCEVFAVATGNACNNANIALSFDQHKRKPGLLLNSTEQQEPSDARPFALILSNCSHLD